jgi:DNA polymerase I-like protein with 3'-5' exonuclease and polymerase domains
MPEAEAKRMIEKIHRGYPQIRDGYHATIQNMLFKNRCVESLLGRKRLFLGPIKPAPPNTPRSACITTYREAYAQLPQSTTADKINQHGIQLLYYNQDQFPEVELLTQIHDSVVFQIPLSVPWIRHAEIVKQVKDSLEQPLKWKSSLIHTPADVAIGLNMCKEEMIEVKSKNFPSDLYTAGVKIENSYRKLRRKQDDK